MDNLDVLVIGTGTAGQSAAYDLAEAGYRVAIVEKSMRPGGTCALSGCQAKKWFYELAEIAARSRHLKDIGITAPPSVSWNQALKAKNHFTENIPADTVASLKGYEIEYLEGEAVFSDANTVLVGNKPIKPRYIIIATGAAPMGLPIEGSEHLLTSSDFLDLEALPQRIVFVGGGVISFELAHFAARLGADPEQIHIIEVMERPLGPFDSDMVEQLVIATRAEGIQVHTSVSVSSIEKRSPGFSVTLSTGETLETDLVVHGAGRSPDIEGLNLQSAGIIHDRRGIEVDGLMTSSVHHIFAIGDVAATVQLARVADAEAHVAAATIIARDEKEPPPDSMDYHTVPAVLFTYPQLGMVGKTEDELKQAGVTYWKSFDKEVGWPTYRRIGMKHAAYKILVDENNVILGAHVLSDNSTGLINTIKQAMLNGTTVPQLYRDNIMSPYPSRESDIIYMLSPLLD